MNWVSPKGFQVDFQLDLARKRMEKQGHLLILSMVWKSLGGDAVTFRLEMAYNGLGRLATRHTLAFRHAFWAGAPSLLSAKSSTSLASSAEKALSPKAVGRAAAQRARRSSVSPRRQWPWPWPPHPGATNVYQGIPRSHTLSLFILTLLLT